MADPEDHEMALGPLSVSSPDGLPANQLEAAGADQTNQNIREHNARLIAEVARSQKLSRRGMHSSL